MIGAFHESPLAPETQAADDRLLQSVLAQGPEGNDVPADSPMVLWVATRVWVEHEEAEHEVQGAQRTYGSTLRDRLA